MLIEMVTNDENFEKFSLDEISCTFSWHRSSLLNASTNKFIYISMENVLIWLRMPESSSEIETNYDICNAYLGNYERDILIGNPTLNVRSMHQLDQVQRSY